MIEISLTRFLDNGSPKVTSLQYMKRQLTEEYNPATDYYKQIRDAIAAYYGMGG